MTPALLALADGRVFRGESCGADGEAEGEVVFNTSMTGYQEILTDPSAARFPGDGPAPELLVTIVGVPVVV